VRTASGVLAAPPQQKQSVEMGSRPVPHLVFIGRQVSRIQAEGPEIVRVAFVEDTSGRPLFGRQLLVSFINEI
jgi:hypothetical protein